MMLVGVKEYNEDSLECYYIEWSSGHIYSLYSLLYEKACMGMHEALHSNFVSRTYGFQSHNSVIVSCFEATLLTAMTYCM